MNHECKNGVYVCYLGVKSYRHSTPLLAFMTITMFLPLILDSFAVFFQILGDLFFSLSIDNETLARKHPSYAAHKVLILCVLKELRFGARSSIKDHSELVLVLLPD